MRRDPTPPRAGNISVRMTLSIEFSPEAWLREHPVTTRRDAHNHQVRQAVRQWVETLLAEALVTEGSPIADVRMDI